MPLQLTCKVCNATSQPTHRRGWRQLAVDGHGQLRLSRNGMEVHRKPGSRPWLHDAWACGTKCTTELSHRFVQRGNFSPFPHSSLVPKAAPRTFRPVAQQRSFSPSTGRRTFVPAQAEREQVAA